MCGRYTFTSAPEAMRQLFRYLEQPVIVTTRQQHIGSDHERMPVIVPSEAFDLWLNCNDVDAKTAEAMIAPAPDGLLEAYEISTAVNRTANDSPKLLEPIVPAAKPPVRVKRVKKDSGQGILF